MGGHVLNFTKARYLAAVLVGGLWAAAFPEPGWAGLAWTVPGALMLVFVGLSGRAAFLMGCVAGAVHYLISLRWLLHMPHPAGAVAGWLALSAYCAVYAGAWTWLSSLLLQSRGVVGEGASREAWRVALRQLAAQSSWQRAATWALLAAVWVSLEMLRARLFSGFAWNLLGVSQWHQLPLLQTASVTGVYGLSFLICWLSLALVGAGISLIHRPHERWTWTAETRMPLFMLVLIAGGGFWALLGHRRERDAARQFVRLALIQPSVPQTLQWDATADATNFTRILGLSEQALALKPDVLVWPEGSFGLSDDTWSRITNLTRAAGASWIFNTATENAQQKPMNSAMWLDPTGQFRGRYDKRRLVMFGERIPLEEWLPFLRYLTPIGSSFVAGTEPVTFSLQLTNRTAPVEIAPIICFEDTFPHGVRDHVRPDTDLLLEITNDAWFGESSAQWQHAANAAFRAVENGVPLVRVANNGLTVWFDAAGIPHDIFGESGSVYQAGFQIIRIPVGVARSETYYHRRGDVFGWTCVGASLWALVRSIRQIRREASQVNARQTLASP